MGEPADVLIITTVKDKPAGDKTDIESGGDTTFAKDSAKASIVKDTQVGVVGDNAGVHQHTQKADSAQGPVQAETIGKVEQHFYADYSEKEAVSPHTIRPGYDEVFHLRKGERRSRSPAKLISACIIAVVPFLLTIALAIAVVYVIPDIPKLNYEQIIYTLLTLALVYTTISLTFLKIVKEISILILCVSLSVGGWFAYTNASNYEYENEKLTDKLHTSEKAKNFIKYLLEKSFIDKLLEKILDKYEGYSQEKKEMDTIIAASRTYKKRANYTTIIFFILSVAFPLFIYMATYDEEFVTALVLTVSIVSLIVGLFAPILIIITYKEIPLLGKIVFLFQSKGIVTTITTLFKTGNTGVAIPLALFSVVLPFLKTIVMGLALFGSNQSAMCLIKSIGKWSVADVFVVALLVTYFTINKEGSTNAEIQTGFYFFLGYAIFSMIAANLLTRSTQKEKTKKPHLIGINDLGQL